MGVTVIRNLSSDKAPAETIEQLLEEGKYYRHPDSAQISYPLVVADQIGTLPTGKDLNVAIVGAGAAGLCALTELAKMKPANNKLTVTIFEADKDSFIHAAQRGISTAGKRAGRVFSARANDDTVYEIGAMRFPEIAGLTWHYAAHAFGPDGKVKVFPNPGKVATEFIFADQVDRYDSDTWLDSNSITLKVKNRVATGLMGDGSPHSAFAYIGQREPREVAELLRAEGTSQETLKEVQKDWHQFAHDNDQYTLEAVVRSIIRSALHAPSEPLPTMEGFSIDETENYYVELFGRFGFGTGGFKSLYSISFVEMMRLLLWDYSNEYTFPVEENVEFFKNLFKKAKELEVSGKFEIKVAAARVSDVFHQKNGDNYQATVAYYDNKDEKTLASQSFDFVILAMPQDQLVGMVARAGYAPKPQDKVTFGDGPLELDTKAFDNVLPALWVSDQYAAANGRAVSAVSMLRMVRSSKVFATIHEDKLKGLPQFKQNPITAIVSDCGLATSYIVPSSIPESKYHTFLASYTWDEDSTRLQRDFGQYPLNPGTDDQSMFLTMINRADRQVLDPVDQQQKRWWLVSVLKDVLSENRLVFDWTTNGSAGGFKLDACGDHYQSNYCFRFHKHAEGNKNNRVFIASDSFSHLGGWLEGAFMSAVNAVAGLVVAANGGNTDSLKGEAEKIFTALNDPNNNPTPNPCPPCPPPMVSLNSVFQEGSPMPSQLSISIAAGLAQKQLDRNEPLNYPEAVAVISNYILEEARKPEATAAKIKQGAKELLRSDQVLDGVDSLIKNLAVDVTLPSGMTTITVFDPIPKLSQ
ncbi:urease subunit gamma [Chromobacterium sp.]|uniref:urease subunit gamma n=1 Tax=Chromobacterium sp. TaxID=306190 RepID=UPI0035AED068